ncbi:o-succinylbenzoate synthase [Longibacter salinarum]|uniref:o-succinylbenzoate synthase n=1 Tax=Longibacter salinarum TaxID=1850348 RepID=A0A2A8D356_9BACT|nr:o-succinylbenzoate synthase [Longibacter salinarum]PEN15304.1 o-succinylbenzoate synthase [Longibacter salinarum]
MPMIERIEVRPYALPLAAPIDLGGMEIDQRHGCLVQAVFRAGDVTVFGVGDVAPLPGFSRETVEEAISALHSIIPSWEGRELPRDSRLGHLKTLPSSSIPSVRFGLEQALASAVAKSQSKRLIEWIRPTARSKVSLNALLMGTPDEIVESASNLETGPGGYRAVKVKVGRHDLHAEAAAIRRLYAMWEETVELRLDANRAWTVEEATSFAEALEDTPISYLEEPLSSPKHLRRWSMATGVPVALDESTREKSVDELTKDRFAAAFVVKPSLIGLLGTIRLERAIRDAGVEVVISSSYESGVGLAGLAMLAAVLGDRDIPAGLDTYRRLAADVTEELLPIQGPTIDVDELWQALPTQI